MFGIEYLYDIEFWWPVICTSIALFPTKFAYAGPYSSYYGHGRRWPPIELLIIQSLCTIPRS